jgi:hypothetical protein
MNIDHEVTLLPNLAPFGTIGCPIGGSGRPGATAPVTAPGVYFPDTSPGYAFKTGGQGARVLR